jgi:hypothetical protein
MQAKKNFYLSQAARFFGGGGGGGVQRCSRTDVCSTKNQLDRFKSCSHNEVYSPQRK